VAWGGDPIQARQAAVRRRRESSCPEPPAPSEEIQEFIEFLNDVNESAEKAKVLAQLRGTRAVVSAQLLSDIDDDGYHAVGIFLSFFVAHCDGMIQADGEGFYEDDRTIVELE
jgi:hypothetical protein